MRKKLNYRKKITSYFKRLLSSLKQVPRATKQGVLAVVLLYVSVAGLVSISVPWLVRGDTRQHVDYVWRVYQGEIPTFQEGITYPPFVEIYGFKPQAASASPPLFYMLHAPVIGPFLENGEWQKAIAVGRGLNTLLGVACALTLAWAGWTFGGRHKAIFAVTTPALSVLIFRFTRLNLDYALDPLLIIWSTLSLVLNYKLLKYGPTKKYLIATALVSVLGMATKAPYIVFLLINLCAVVLSLIMHGTQNIFKKLIRGSIVSGIILLIVLLVTGWYYYFWNYQNTGKWYSASPAGYTGNRPYKSLISVLTSTRLWGHLYNNYSNIPEISVAITSFAIAGWFNTKRIALRKFIMDKPKAVAVLLMSIAFIGMFLVQVVFGIGYGSLNFRYMLPAILPLALFLSYGLLKFEWTRGQLVTLTTINMGFFTLVVFGGSNLHNLYEGALVNGFPAIFPTILLSLFIVSSALLAKSLFILTKKGNKKYHSELNQ